MLLQPRMHAADRELGLLVDARLGLGDRKPRRRRAFELERRRRKPALRRVDPRSSKLKRRLAGCTAQEEAVVVRPREVGGADDGLDVALERLRRLEAARDTWLAPPQDPRPTTLQESSVRRTTNLMTFNPQEPGTHRRNRDDRNRRHAMRWYIERSPTPATAGKKAGIAPHRAEAACPRKHEVGAALTQRMRRCEALAVLACSLALGCGRTPIDLFEADIRDEEVFDPIVDGCNKVDFLLVVDNSSSMGDNQAKLALGVRDFVDGVSGVLEAVDSVHIGVVTTDRYDHNAPECDQLGSLVTQTGGHGSSDEVCGPYVDGHRFMTENDDLEEALECTVRVGTTGSNSERPLSAIHSAVAPNLDAVATCNEGFIRPDALLVVVVMTDEDGQPSPAYDTLLEAKGGNDEAVVVLTIAHTEDDTCRRGGHATQANVLMSFTRRFPHGIVESICAPSFDSVFERATDVVQAACGR